MKFLHQFLSISFSGLCTVLPPVSRAPIGDVRVAAHRLFIPPDEPKVDTEMTLFNPDDVATPDQPGVSTTS